MPIFNAPFSTSVFMPPFWVTSEAVSVQENNTTVTTLDAGYVTQYSIVGGVDASKFSISGSTLRFISAPDYEVPTDSGTNNIYDVTVRATNPAGFADRSIAVTVTNDLADDKAIIVNGVTHYLSSSDYIVGTGSDRRGTRTGSLITMTVPGAVTVRLDMWGGGGGDAYEDGGAGGYARGTITLQPGSTYKLLVAGGGGGTSSGDPCHGGYGGGGAGGPLGGSSGGSNGSSFGNGGSGPYYGNYPQRQGGGGGGCSGLFLTNTNTPLLVAGGGGGAGGGSNATDGYTGGYQNGGPNSTRGGDQSSGGLGQGFNAGNGGKGYGGGGGYSNASSSGDSGGGGGGGWYGGGGGTRAQDGGGGSSYFNSSYMSSTTLSAQQGQTRTPYTAGSINHVTLAGRGGNSAPGGYGGRISIRLVS